MTSSQKNKDACQPVLCQDVEDAPAAMQMVPWAATGRMTPRDIGLFAAARLLDPAIEADLVAAAAEYAAVVALGDAMGRPSPRPMLALFAAIDAEKATVAPNVLTLNFDRRRATAAIDGRGATDWKPQRISWRR